MLPDPVTDSLVELSVSWLRVVGEPTRSKRLDRRWHGHTSVQELADAVGQR
jgi:hypothetical protein